MNWQHAFQGSNPTQGTCGLCWKESSVVQIAASLSLCRGCLFQARRLCSCLTSNGFILSVNLVEDLRFSGDGSVKLAESGGGGSPSGRKGSSGA